MTNRFLGLAGVPVDSWCGEKEAFLGRYHGYGNPVGVIDGKLNCEGNYNENSCGALTAVLKLAPGEKKEMAFLVGMKKMTRQKRLLRVMTKIASRFAKGNWKN